MITIKAKPIDTLPRQIVFDPKDIIKMYHGQLNCCRCGCAGDYAEPGVTPTADRVIQNALNSLQQYAGYGEVEYEYFEYADSSKNELYLEFCTEVRESKDDGYYVNDEERIGYAFYIKNPK